MAETNAAVSTKSQEESQKAFKERLLKIMGADATEAYLKAYGFDEGNAFARNYDGTLPAEGEEPAFFTNIDEQGNVLFLDEDRALRKSSFPGKRPVYRNKPNGLGFFNFLVVHTSARQWNWKVVLKVFAAILSASKVLSKPGTFGDRLYRKAMMFDPPEKSYSAGFTFNLNVDVPEDVPGTAKYNDFVVHKNSHHAQEEFACKHMQLEAEGADGAEVASGQAASASGQAAAAAGAAGTTGAQAASADAADKPKTITLNKVVSKNVAHDMATVTLPIDLVKKAIDEAEFIGGMKECLCRAGGDCQTYPPRPGLPVPEPWRACGGGPRHGGGTDEGGSLRARGPRRCPGPYLSIAVGAGRAADLGLQERPDGLVPGNMLLLPLLLRGHEPFEERAAQHQAGLHAKRLDRHREPRPVYGLRPLHRFLLPAGRHPLPQERRQDGSEPGDLPGLRLLPRTLPGRRHLHQADHAHERQHLGVLP